MRKQKTRSKGRYMFRETWTYPQEIERLILEELGACERPVLHVPCGASKIGNVRCDLYYEAKDVVKADMYNLPFENESFATIVSDPPWELPYHKRSRLLREYLRILKPGGILILNAFWLPSWNGVVVVVERVWLILPKGGFPRNPALLSVIRKCGENQARLTEVLE